MTPAKINPTIIGNDSQVKKEHHTSIARHAATGNAITSGDNSPAITGNGNSVTYNQSTDHTVHMEIEQLSSNEQKVDSVGSIYEFKVACYAERCRSLISKFNPRDGGVYSRRRWNDASEKLEGRRDICNYPECVWPIHSHDSDPDSIYSSTNL